MLIVVRVTIKTGKGFMQGEGKAISRKAHKGAVRKKEKIATYISRS